MVKKTPKQVAATEKASKAKNKDKSTKVAEVRPLTMPERQKYKKYMRMGLHSTDAIKMILPQRERYRFMMMNQKDVTNYIKALPSYRVDYK